MWDLVNLVLLLTILSSTTLLYATIKKKRKEAVLTLNIFIDKIEIGELNMADFSQFKDAFAELKAAFAKIDADIEFLKAELVVRSPLTQVQVDELFADLSASVADAKVIDEKTPEPVVV